MTHGEYNCNSKQCQPQVNLLSAGILQSGRQVDATGMRSSWQSNRSASLLVTGECCSSHQESIRWSPQDES